MSEDPVFEPFGRRRKRALREEEQAVPADFENLRRAAERALPADVWRWVSAGAGDESTRRANRDGFDRWRIVPRPLRDVSRRDLRTDLFGTTLPAPVALAPIGNQRRVHEQAEFGTARAAADLGVPFALSTAATRSIEAVAGEMGDAPRWFQLYPSPDRELTRSFLDRAEQAGYGAVLLTVDAPTRGWRPTEIDEGYPARGHPRANYFSDPVFRDALDSPPEEEPEAAQELFRERFYDAALTWEDLAYVREATDLPVVLKGVLHPDDAERAVECDLDGVVVSTHGGNHLAGAVAAVDALPAVVDRVGDRVPVLFDSGVRYGADAFRAVALGADAVLLGRPYLYGLAVAGEAGVREVVANLLADLDLTMAMAGCSSVGDVDGSRLLGPDRRGAFG